MTTDLVEETGIETGTVGATEEDGNITMTVGVVAEEREAAAAAEGTIRMYPPALERTVARAPPEHHHQCLLRPFLLVLQTDTGQART